MQKGSHSQSPKKMGDLQVFKPKARKQQRRSQFSFFTRKWDQLFHGGYRGWVQGKTRILCAWIFVLGLLGSVRDYPHWAGTVVCFLGASLRFWASGYLRKDSRPAVGGPYAFVRNPLYLGTYLMAIGAAAAISQTFIWVIMTLLFAAIYHYIILDEETKLQKLFQAPYRTYCRYVPRFFPRVWPPFAPASASVLSKVNPDTAHLKFSWTLASKNKAHEAFLSFAALFSLLIVLAYCWKNL